MPDQGEMPERADCIGAGTYYQLQRPTTPESETQSTRNDTAPWPWVEPHVSEVRYHPDTGEPYILTAIVSDLYNRDWYVRVRAAWALGSTRDIEGLVPLIEALGDEHIQVRDRASDALNLMENIGGPLEELVLLCDTVDNATRTDMLMALIGYRLTRTLSFEQRSAKGYCESALKRSEIGVSEEEREVIAALKRASSAVLAELSKRSDSQMLLRAGDSNTAPHNNQLLRSSEAGLRPGEVDNLLRPSDK